jgi:hypothetical protein
VNKTCMGILTLALALFAMSASAEDYLSPTDERVRLSLGFMHLSSNTDIRVDSSTGVPGTPVNAEDDLGLEKSSFEPKFQVMLRVGQRHTVRFDYFTLDRTGNTIVTTPIIFRDVVLQPGDPLNSALSMRNLGITYGYSFIHRESFELAATLGVNVTDISSRVRVNTQTRHVDQKEDAAGPFPTLGIDATYVLSKRFYLDGRAQYLKVNIDDLNGSMGFFELNSLYRLRPNVSFALGYTLVRTNLTSNQSKQSGYFNFDSKGPQFFVRVAF